MQNTLLSGDFTKTSYEKKVYLQLPVPCVQIKDWQKMSFLCPLPCFAAQFSLRPAQYLDAYNRLMRVSNPRNISEYFTNVFVLSFTCIL